MDNPRNQRPQWPFFVKTQILSISKTISFQQCALLSGKKKFLSADQSWSSKSCVHLRRFGGPRPNGYDGRRNGSGMMGGWGWGGDEAVRHLRSSLEGEGDWKCMFADDMRCMKRRHSGAKGAQIFGGVRRKVKNTMQQWDVAEVCCKEICELHTAVHSFVFVATVPLHHLQILFLHFAQPPLAQPDCSVEPVFSRIIPVHLSKTNPADFINMHS